MEVWGVVFAESVAFGDAGWLVTSFDMKVVSTPDSFLSEEEDPETPGATVCVNQTFRTNQDHYTATVWTAFTEPPTTMLTVADMPALIDAGGEDLMIPWRCTGFQVTFDRESLIYNCQAFYSAWGQPISSPPQKWIVPADLADFDDVTPEDPV